MNETPQQPPVRPYEIVIVLIISTLLFTFAFEFLARLADRDLFSTDNLILRPLETAPHEFEFDPHLAWVPVNSKSYVSQPYASGLPFKITTEEFGFRKNIDVWKTPIESKMQILAVGDSFTFGNEVSDEETWPNHLQAMMKTKVANGGVPMYGFDQVVLRLESQVDRVKPQVVLVSITPQDLLRTGYSKQIRSLTNLAVDKPYFRLEGSGLKLMTETVEPPKAKQELGWFRDWLGRSHLMNHLFRRFAVNYWLSSGPMNSAPSQYKTGDSPIEVSCRLLERVKALGHAKNFLPVIVAQAYSQQLGAPYESDELLTKVFECSQKLGLAGLSLDPVLKEIFEKRPDEFPTLFLPWAHMVNRGNLLVAQKITEELNVIFSGGRCETLARDYGVTLPCTRTGNQNGK